MCFSCHVSLECSTHRGQKRELDALNQELQAIVSCRVGAGN